MPRTIVVTAPAAMADDVIERLHHREGVVGVTRQHGVSLDPPGDIVTVHVSNDAAREVFGVLADIGVPDHGSIMSAAPRSFVTGGRGRRELARESNETVWDEMAFLMREDSNLRVNFLAQALLAGGICGVGLQAGFVDIVIASMVIAPAFEPIMRIPFGLIAGPRQLASSGFWALLAGYALIASGSAIAVLLLSAVGGQPIEVSGQRWVVHWSTVNAISVLVGVLAGAAGAFIVIGQRSVLTTGVMIALGLIPSMSIVGMGLALGDGALATRALARWLTDASLVLVSGATVIGLKQLLVHRRRAIA